MEDFKGVAPTAGSVACGGAPIGGPGGAAVDQPEPLVDQPLVDQADSYPMYSPNWSGYQVPNSCCNNATFTWAQSAFQFSVPDSGSGDEADFWSGIGNTVLIQDGLEGFTAPELYLFWFEDYPQDPTYILSPAFYRNDVAYVYTLYQGDNVAYYYFENETTGLSQPYQAAAPYVGFRDADFIAEKQDGVGLADFGNKQVSDSAYGTSSTAYELPSQAGVQTDNVIMTSNGMYTGHFLAEPSTVGSDDSFEQIWFAAN